MSANQSFFSQTTPAVCRRRFISSSQKLFLAGRVHRSSHFPPHVGCENVSPTSVSSSHLPSSSILCRFSPARVLDGGVLRKIEGLHIRLLILHATPPATVLLQQRRHCFLTAVTKQADGRRRTPSPSSLMSSGGLSERLTASEPDTAWPIAAICTSARLPICCRRIVDCSYAVTTTCFCMAATGSFFLSRSNRLSALRSRCTSLGLKCQSSRSAVEAALCLCPYLQDCLANTEMTQLRSLQYIQVPGSTKLFFISLPSLFHGPRIWFILLCHIRRSSDRS